MIPLDPQTKDQLIQEIGVRFSTTAPTKTPDKETELWVIYTSSELRLYAWNPSTSEWKYKILDNA